MPLWSLKNLTDEKRMKIALASDHGGYELKETLKYFLKEKEIEVDDFGTFSEESVDYPDFAKKATMAVVEGKADGAVLICGTGIGMSITANKFKGIRAALVHDIYTAQMAKEHNNANIICMGGRTTDKKLAKEMVSIWLSSKFEAGRHARRLDKIKQLEDKLLV